LYSRTGDRSPGVIGSTLNAVAVLDAFRAYPRRPHLLRLGAAAMLGHLSNIYPSGAASMAWHGDPSILQRDAYSGDYGIGLYGYWRSAAAYLSCSGEAGWECTLCDVLRTSPARSAQAVDACAGAVTIALKDALRRRAYVAPLGVTVEVEGAQLAELTFDGATREILLSLRRHVTAPSTHATLFTAVERVYPPPAVAVGGLVASCADKVESSGTCARASPMQGAFVVKLGGDGTQRVKIAPR
jgi:hypothetical protein